MADAGNLVLAVLMTAGAWVWARRAGRADRARASSRDGSGEKDGILKRASRKVAAALSVILGFIFFSSALGLMMWGTAVLAGQVIGWLRWARWEERSAAEIFAWLGQPYPMVTWQGVQRILDFTFDAPLAIVLFFTGVAVLLFASIVVDERR